MGLRPAALAFFKEVKDSIERALAEGTAFENLKLEINSSKYILPSYLSRIQ